MREVSLAEPQCIDGAASAMPFRRGYAALAYVDGDSAPIARREDFRSASVSALPRDGGTSAANAVQVAEQQGDGNTVGRPGAIVAISFSKADASTAGTASRQGADTVNIDSIAQSTSSEQEHVLLGDAQLAELKAGIKSLALSEVVEIATIAQVEIDRRYFEREHDPEIAPRLVEVA